MESLPLLAAPYLSLLVVCRTPRIAAVVARHPALTLATGWLAVLGLLAALLALWDPPAALLAACAALSGLAMSTPARDGGDDGPPPAPGDPPPAVDWDAFDRIRGHWSRRPGRSPAGVA